MSGSPLSEDQQPFEEFAPIQGTATTHILLQFKEQQLHEHLTAF